MATRYKTGTLSIAETCKRLDCSRWTVARRIKNGELTASKRGTARNAEVRVDEDSVKAWLIGHPIEAQATG